MAKAKPEEKRERRKKGEGRLYKPKFTRKPSGQRYECPVWWAQYCQNGKVIRRSTGESNYQKASHKLHTWMGNPEAPTPEAERLTFEDLVKILLNDYVRNERRSSDRAERSVEQLKKFFAGYRAVQITSVAVDAYIKQRMQGVVKDDILLKPANATVNRELACLKRMLSLAVRANILARRPHIAMLKESAPRSGFFSDADLLALLDTLPEYLRAPVEFAARYGWRKEEVFGLKWEHVDPIHNTVRLEATRSKNGEGRTVVLAGRMLDVFRMLRARTQGLEARTGEPIPWVFHRQGQQIKSCREAWAGGCKRVGLDGMLFHDLRRTAVRDMVRKGIPERVAMMISGHKTRSIFDRYNIVSLGDLEEAAKRMNGVENPNDTQIDTHADVAKNA